MQPVIFSDLDGTLLHPETYSFEEAVDALDSIRQRNIPLILCSSKTRAELEHYLDRLNMNHPFISENGGGIYIPVGYFSSMSRSETAGKYDKIVFGRPYAEIRREFDDVRKHLGLSVSGFGDMTVDEVAALTGLPIAEAHLARLRDFTEPFVFRQAVDDRLFDAFNDRGLTWTKGRLYCLMGQHDKGKSVHLLKRWYEKEHGKIISIGLGDAMNDLPLLNEVDLPVLVQKQDGSYDQGIEISGLTLAPGIGPHGWNTVIRDLLKI